jgi:hypothetical protein
MTFADSASITKSSNLSMWAIYSSISELPPIIRNSQKNIIVHCLWSGSLDINMILDRYNKKTQKLFENGLEMAILNRTIRVRMLGMICDTVGRAKVCYSTQFNGQYGCLHCMHPNDSVSFTDGTKKKVYIYDQKIKARTHADYLKQVEIAEQSRAKRYERCEGIKGHKIN